MILVDANLLIYAANKDAAHHSASRAWWHGILSGTEEVALAWIVILAFLRVTTRPGVFPRPLDPQTALNEVNAWLAQPFVSVVGPGERHWAILKNLLNESGLGGNLTSDAHLAALALEHGAQIYSSDHDFRRFAGVRHVNPLTSWDASKTDSTH